VTFDLGHDDSPPSLEALRLRLAALAEDDGGSNSIVVTLLEMLEQHDRQAAEHAFRVAEVACAIGAHLRLPAAQLARLRLAALLHDIGKLSLSDDVLNKPGPLSDGEWQQLRSHPEYGYQLIVAAVHPEVAETVRDYCERPDGRGYPDGKQGNQIPMMARILLTADAYDAMQSARPYRPPMSFGETVQNLQAGAGTEFDAEAVEALAIVAAKRGWSAAA